MISDPLHALDRPDLQATATRLDLTILETFMLWPNDLAWRQRALNHSRALELKSRGKLSIDEATAALDFALLGASAAEIAAEVKRRFHHGLLAGIILTTQVQQLSIKGSHQSMGDIIERACRTLSKKNPAGGRSIVQVTPRTANRYWAAYRPVAHFWAAYWAAAQEADRVAFPCTVSTLGLFLAEAEWWRGAGVTTVPYKAAKPILVDPAPVPGVAWLPNVELKFPTE